MATSSTSFPRQSEQDQGVWQGLKDAIASSSGFKRWQAEKVVGDQPLEPMTLEDEVYTYLRETLKTLAY